MAMDRRWRTRRRTRLAMLGALLVSAPLSTVVASAMGAAGRTASPPPLPTPPASPPPAPQLPALSPPPPLPPQPGIGAAPCSSRTSPGASPWRLVSRSASMFEGRPDPWNPCVMYRATDGQTLQRSTDSGATWTTVFHDSAATSGAGQFAFSASGLMVPKPGTVELSEDGNGDGLVRSGDRGRTWTMPDAGLDGQAVLRVIPAPGNPAVSYALTTGGSSLASSATAGLAPPAQLYRSDNDGASWSAVTLPIDAQVSDVTGSTQRGVLSGDGIAVDPTDPQHVYAVAEARGVATPDSNGQTCQPKLFESRDGGDAWVLLSTLPLSRDCGGYVDQQPTGDVPPTGYIPQLVVVRTPRHPLRLLVASSFSQFGSTVALSDDGGRTWSPSAIPSLDTGFWALAQSPTDGDDLLWVDTTVAGDGQLEVITSTDGLDHATGLAPPVLSPTTNYWVSMTADPPTNLHDGVGHRSPFTHGGTPPVAVTADSHGSFYVNLTVDCQGYAVADGASQQACSNRYIGTSGGTTIAWTLWEVTPQRRGPVFARPEVPVAPGGGTAYTPLTPSTPCPIPAWAGNDATQSGSLTFDGRELLYTQLNETTAPHHGVIHAIDPGGCGPLPDIDVVLPADAGISSIGNLTYDARRNRLWVAPPGGGGLFLVEVTDGASSPRKARLEPGLPTQGCGWALSYDQYRDVLWTCGKNYAAPMEVATDGTEISSCYQSNVLAPPATMATWTLAGSDHLYVQSEDDSTLFEYDPVTCLLQNTYAHRTFAEPLAEDEQMACDSLTYGPDGLSSITGPSTMLWLRDAQAFLVAPYAIPDGACPFPTAAAFSTTTPMVAPGATAQLCATVLQLYPGGTLNLPAGLPVTFTLSGRAAVTVAARTLGGAGPVCVGWPAAVPPGRYTVTASFDPVAANRTAQYLPSQGTGTLVVTGPLAGHGPPTKGAALLGQLPTAPGDAPVAAPQPQPGAQGQAETQAQAQSETQVQTQAQGQGQSQSQIQAGMAVQRRRQAEVATGTVHTRTATALQAVGRRRGVGREQALLLMAEAAATAIALTRRPAVAVAAVRRRRRRWNG